MNNILLTFFLILLISSAVRSQQVKSLSGIVVDKNTNEPLAYASVGIKHTSIATISNDEGKFTIGIPKANVDDSLVVSMLGYNSWQIGLEQFDYRTEIKAELSMSSVTLQEIVVRDSLSTELILKRAYNNIKRNYLSRPFQLEGFYRETLKADSQYVSLIEAAILLESRGYKDKGREKVRLQQFRKSAGYENPYVPFWNKSNLLVAFLGQNFVKYKSKSLLKYKAVQRKANTSIDGVMVYVIEVNERDDFWLNTLYIRCDNYAIIRAEERYDVALNGARDWSVENNPLVRAFPQQRTLQLNFKLFQGKYFPDNYNMAFHVHYHDVATGKRLLDFTINQQFAVTQIITDSLSVIADDKWLRHDESLKNVNWKYDPEFWKNFTIIRATPIDSLVQRDLEKQIQLEEQFKRD